MSDRALPYQKPSRLHPDPSPGQRDAGQGRPGQTYHSSFRWSSQTDWTPERMGQKFVPSVIIWDEVCTVPRPTLETFLDCLEGLAIMAYKQQDQAKGLRFSLKVDYILSLMEAQNNRCAACSIELIWAYQPKDTQQFSVDRFDNSAGHIHDNVRLTCLECNRKRGAAALSA